MERKFRDNVGKRWPKERTTAILRAMWALEQTNNVSTLLSKLAMKT